MTPATIAASPALRAVRRARPQAGQLAVFVPTNRRIVGRLPLGEPQERQQARPPRIWRSADGVGEVSEARGHRPCSAPADFAAPPSSAHRAPRTGAGA